MHANKKLLLIMRIGP